MMIRSLAIILSVASGLVLVACGWSEQPTATAGAGRIYNQPDAQPVILPHETLREAPPKGKAYHIMQAGESYYTVAQYYGVNLRDLLVENNLQAPFIPRIGEKLRLPTQRRYQVKKGDTLYSIARKTGTDVAEIVRMNGIAAPYIIHPNQILAMPAPTDKGKIKTAKADKAEPAPKAAPKAARKAAPQAQPEADPDEAPEDDILAADQDQASLSAPPSRQPKPQVRMVPKKPVKSDMKLSLTKNGLPQPILRPDLVAKAPYKPVSLKPSALAAGGFHWPVQGRVIAKFGPLKPGLVNDGINIAASRGTAVRAAQNGVVAYSGAALKGFGRLILVKHSDGYVSAYAHNEENLVRPGDSVVRGQVIARVGASGEVDKPQLHFQIRKNGRPLNPLSRLSKQG